jgi:hypothetical protein
VIAAAPIPPLTEAELGMAFGFDFRRVRRQANSQVKRSAKLLIMLFGCLHLVCGGSLGMMQVAAWGKMLVSYSQDAGVVQAVAMTFDGEHPCSLCRVIKEARETCPTPEKAPTPTSDSASKLVKDYVSPIERVQLAPVLTVREVLAWTTITGCIGCGQMGPPSPPPRTLG